ncbi:MAG: PIN domain-containing protein [Rhodospirillaceae bacterium]|nr:PIN domain-containing protein [Rhodospirillaceae bacterium]
MIVYVDSSVLLRHALHQPDALPEWPKIRRGLSSKLIATECLRTLDRVRIRARLSESDMALKRSAVLALISELDLAELDQAVLDRAAQPMPTQLGTLDAIHLATALLWRDMAQADLVLATHDTALAMAGMAHGLPVIGASVA